MRKFQDTLAAILIASCCYAQGVITTVAGTSRIFRGDGAPAVTVKTGGLPGVVVDSAGNAYLSCNQFDIVVKVSPAGIVTVVAGNGVPGFSGDGGPARSASLFAPSGLALDPAGNLYIADSNNNRVRKVTPEGIITTVAGGATNLPATETGDGGLATAARLQGARAMFVDTAGNLYIAEFSRIRKVDPSGVITTVVGNANVGFTGDGGPATSATINSPNGIALDGAGNLYFTDSNNNRIRMVNPAGIITTFAGDGNPAFSGDGGPALGASLFFPNGLVLDGAGNLYVADQVNSRIRRIGPSGIISTVAGNGDVSLVPIGDEGPATLATVPRPRGIALQGGSLYITDLTGRLRQVDPSGRIQTIAGSGLENFSGDGGPGISASLNSPSGVAFDSAGNLYIADGTNGRIRRLATDGTITTFAGLGGPVAPSGNGGPATQAGLGAVSSIAFDGAGNLSTTDLRSNSIRKIDTNSIITAFAGTGVQGSSGDGGQALAASLDLSIPSALAFDPAGNLYFSEQFTNRVRRIDPAGIITTVAGNGVAGFSGDGGPAVSASLTRPYGVAVDAARNIFIADTGNTRIRQVRLDGTIVTIAGDGTGGFTGDGGPASAARITVQSLFVDASGNLYFSGGPRIRKIGTDGVITTIAGSGGIGFAGDGGLATKATFDNPVGMTMDAAGNFYIADSNNDRIRKILAVAPPFSVSTTTLDFAAPAGTPSVAAQQLTVLSPITGLAWTAQRATQSCGNWLTIPVTAGTAPGVIAVSVNVANLQPRTCRGTVTVTSSTSSTPAQTIAVTLTVQPSVLAQLVVETPGLAFQTQVGSGSPAPRALAISNGGIGTLLWAAQASTTSGGNWLTVSAASGSVTPATPTTIQIRAAIGTLAPGTYSGSIRVTSSTTNQTETVPVTFTIAQAPQTILVSQNALTFTGVQGGSIVPPQTIGILNIGAGTMPWTLQATPLSGGNWLSVSPGSGSSVANSLTVPLVDVRVSVAGLRAGQYSGVIYVTATGANNTPQIVTVTFNVLPPGSNPGVLVRPTGLIFVRQQGTSSPSSQVVRLATAGVKTLQTVVNPSTFNGVPWLDALPKTQSWSASAPPTFSVQPALGSLAPGVYFGALTLLFDDNTLQAVDVLFVVTPAVRPQRSGRSDADGCVAQQLYAAMRSLNDSFTVPAGSPTQLQVLVKDDCDAPAPGATVLATFSNGDTPLALASLGNGLYEGAWRPLKAGPVSITVRATTALASTQKRVEGQVGAASSNLPAVGSGGVVNAANFARGEALAPGSIISVFGTNLASGQAGATRMPLDTRLAGATLSVAGVDAPLFFSSPGQINAQLPFTLAANTRPQVVVRVQQAGGGTEALTSPETITVTEARPGIFSINQQGTGAGAILNQDFTVNSAAVAAARGSTVQVFATGLGATQPSVTSGQASPAQPLANVVVPVTARVGGLAAPVSFAGLAPGFVGLYQVNVVVPTGVAPGDVALTLIQNGVSSNSVTLAVR